MKCDSLAEFERAFDDGDLYCLNNATDGGIPEGTSAEWWAAIEAIRAGKSYSAKRLGVWKEGMFWCINSPRNSYGPRDYFLLHVNDAETFCRDIEDVLALHDDRFIHGAGI